MDGLSSQQPPKIVLCGLPRSGKTSISRVVFQKMPPHETLFLETTHKPVKGRINPFAWESKAVKHNSLVQFQVSDYPGSVLNDSSGGKDALIQEALNGFSAGGKDASPGALVFVIDAQDEPYHEAIIQAKRVITKVYERSPKTCFEVFIHKVDGDLFLSEENKSDCQTEIQSKITEEIYDTCPSAHITFHCTSIYDHSIFEAMSKVVQKLITELPVLEQLIDLLVTNCRMEKGFLFDVVSKIYIATDSGAVDSGCYELCSDMIDVVIDVSCIYGLLDGEDDALAYDSQSSCVIQLSNGMLLYLKQVEQFLAFACLPLTIAGPTILIREENFDRQYLLDYNINVFKKSLQQLSRLIQAPRGSRTSGGSQSQTGGAPG